MIYENLDAVVRNESQLRAALESADIAPLLMVLIQLGGDESILDEVRPHIHGAWNFMAAVPPGLKTKVCDQLIAVMREYAAGVRRVPPKLSDRSLRKMMDVAVGQPVPDEYIPLILEEIRYSDGDLRTVHWRRKPSEETLKDFRTVIIGAGLSGLCMGIKLREAGIAFSILEKNDAVGGTWYENSYPGCGVDTPNHFFSFSFEPNHDWSEHFSKRDELWTYLDRCADKYAIRRNIRFRTEVVAARYDAMRAVWVLSIRDGDGNTEELDANVLVTAVGQLNRPAIPDIAGLEDFKGAVFHTARWDSSHRLAGKRVAMIGTGASGMQTGPSIAAEVERLVIFQRTPHWAIANPNYHARVAEGKKWAMKHIPFYAKWYRFTLFWASSDGLHAALQKDPAWQTPDISLNAENQKIRELLIEHMRAELDGDEVLMKKVTPAYPPYGKRMLRDNHWYRMLRRPNVDLVTEPIRRIDADAILTDGGARYPVDMIVLATGFEAGKMLAPMHVTGRDRTTIRGTWGDDDPRAYLGISVPQFPNMFMLYGPNTNLAHGGSIFFHTECQVHYIMQALREMLEKNLASIECRPEPHDAYNERLDDAHKRMVWTHPGVGNWYRNARGRVFANSPWRLVDYWSLTREFRVEDYVVTSRASSSDARAGSWRQSGVTR